MSTNKQHSKKQPPAEGLTQPVDHGPLPSQGGSYKREGNRLIPLDRPADQATEKATEKTTGENNG